MELTLNNVIDGGWEVVSQSEFAKSKGGITLQAVRYAMANGLIDFVVVGLVRHPVLSQRSLDYAPNASPKRPTVMET